MPAGHRSARSHGPVRGSLARHPVHLRAVHAPGGAAIARRGLSRCDRQHPSVRTRRDDRPADQRADPRADPTDGLGRRRPEELIPAAPGTFWVFHKQHTCPLSPRSPEPQELSTKTNSYTNKFLAKLASDLRKPDGFVVITEENKQEILDPLPVGRIWGVGKVTEGTLHAHGIRTIAQLRGWTCEGLRSIVGNAAEELLRLAHGEDDRPVEPDRERKSLSSEQTFATDLRDESILSSVLLEEVEEVAERLRRHGLKARTITLKLRYGDFRTVTRSETLKEATNLTKPLWEAAERVFRKWQMRSGGPLRLLGFAASGLEP
ncbi:MAG: hypothetical protein FJ280_31520, partial [Planctomycetes bacterium]|nr:hypothetical protein [Planctomycetota bacterium]